MSVCWAEIEIEINSDSSLRKPALQFSRIFTLAFWFLLPPASCSNEHIAVMLSFIDKLWAWLSNFECCIWCMTAECLQQLKVNNRWISSYRCMLSADSEDKFWCPAYNSGELMTKDYCVTMNATSYRRQLAWPGIPRSDTKWHNKSGWSQKSKTFL